MIFRAPAMEPSFLGDGHVWQLLVRDVDSRAVHGLVLDNGLVGAGMSEGEDGNFYRGLIIALVISLVFWFAVWLLLT
jgi:hypothetical protein